MPSDVSDPAEYWADIFADERDEWRERALAAEAHVEQLRKALRRIQGCTFNTYGTTEARIRRFRWEARQALALPEGERE